jgi:hypothetical protein
MEEENDYIYSRCPNCGKYFPKENNFNIMFCSEECNIFYRTCKSCGDFFISSRNEIAIYCSGMCGITPEEQTPPEDQFPEVTQIPLPVLHQIS